MGCNFDKEQVWACAYDGHACEADAECCGSCVNGTCAGELNLFPLGASGQDMTQQQQEDVPPKKKKFIVLLQIGTPALLSFAMKY